VSGYVVLANEHAGSTERDAVAVAVARLAEEAPTTLRWTGSPDDFEGAVRDLAADAQLVVAGGDGSIHLALACLDDLDRTDRPVGIVPLGTGNDFARNHGLPLEPRAAAEVVVRGRPVPVDVIELRSGDHRELVANNLHIGLGVASAQRAKPMKPVLGRFAYPVATAVQGAVGSGRQHRISVDGEVVWDRPLLAGLFLLGPSMGGGIEVIDTDTRSLDVVLVGDVSVRDRLGLVRAALDNDLAEHPAARRWAAVGTVRIEADGGVAVDVDGELDEHDQPVELTHRRARWQVLAPPR
jgi:diacylglycerol kinase family enzyme